MAQDENKAKALIQSIQAELHKTKVDAVRKRVKELMVELEKADKVREGIVSQIEAEVASLGEGADIREVLG